MPLLQHLECNLWSPLPHLLIKAQRYVGACVCVCVRVCVCVGVCVGVYVCGCPQGWVWLRDGDRHRFRHPGPVITGAALNAAPTFRPVGLRAGPRGPTGPSPEALPRVGQPLLLWPGPHLWSCGMSIPTIDVSPFFREGLEASTAQRCVAAELRRACAEVGTPPPHAPNPLSHAPQGLEELQERALPTVAVPVGFPPLRLGKGPQALHDKSGAPGPEEGACASTRYTPARIRARPPLRSRTVHHRQIGTTQSRCHNHPTPLPDTVGSPCRPPRIRTPWGRPGRSIRATQGAPDPT